MSQRSSCPAAGLPHSGPPIDTSKRSSCNARMSCVRPTVSAVGQQARRHTSFLTYLLMNSLTVMSVCDHSSSVYLEPTSTGTVRQPAISWMYSKL